METDTLNPQEIFNESLRLVLENYYSVNVLNGIKVENLDEVHAALKNELSRVASVITKTIDSKDYTKLLEEISKNTKEKPPESVKVSNLSDIKIPEQKDLVIPPFPSEITLSAQTQKELRKQFLKLGDIIKEATPTINVPLPPSAPAPIVRVDVPPLDIGEITLALAPLQRLFNDDEAPLNIKIPELVGLFTDLKDSLEKNGRQMAAFSGGPSVVSLKDSAGHIIDPMQNGGTVAIDQSIDGTTNAVRFLNASALGTISAPGTNILTTQPPKQSTAGTSTGVTVGSTSTTVLAANSSRVEAIIVNDSNQDVYLKYGSSATMNSGIRLNANGGTLIETVYTGIITGICSSGSKNVTVTEV